MKGGERKKMAKQKIHEDNSKPKSDIAWDILDAIRAKIKTKAKDYEALEKLAKENCELAEFLNDIDQLISGMCWRALAKDN